MGIDTLELLLQKVIVFGGMSYQLGHKRYAL